MLFIGGRGSGAGVLVGKGVVFIGEIAFQFMFEYGGEVRGGGPK